MDISLINAFVASVALHALILLPLHNPAVLLKEKEIKKDMVVEYIEVKEPARVELTRRPVVARAEETPRVELKKNREMLPSATPKTVESKKNAIGKRKADEIIAAEEARIRSTKDYAGYYQLIREKVRQRLKANYRDTRREGNVRIAFVLDSYGALRDIDVDEKSSVQDKNLRDIAVRSMREASPFPAFPKALSRLPRMTFDVVISFRRE